MIVEQPYGLKERNPRSSTCWVNVQESEGVNDLHKKIEYLNAKVVALKISMESSKPNCFTVWMESTIQELVSKYDVYYEVVFNKQFGHWLWEPSI